MSSFGGSAWEWREERQQYYLHQFAIQQADLNYRSPEVVEEVKDVIRYWMSFGIDGFRIDAVPYLFENESLPNEPLSGDPNAVDTDANYLSHIYTQNQNETFDMIQQWREVVDEYSAKDGVTRYIDHLDNVIRYWLDKGFDGFRIDAVNWLFENTSLADEPLSGNTNANEDEYNYLNHIYTSNQPETFEMVQQWREVVEEYKAQDGLARALITEAYADLENTFKYMGTEERPGAHLTFNFFMISQLSNTSTAQDFYSSITEWIDNVPQGKWSDWVLGNHDQHRIGSRFGSELIDGLNMILQWLPGTAVTYNGEEIGMVDTPVSWEETVDPAGLNAGPERYQLFSRDPERSPYQWDNTTSAGFSNNTNTWLPVNSNYLTLNLAEEINAKVSHYKVYQNLVAERASKTLRRGSVNITVIGDVLAFTSGHLREYEPGLVANLGHLPGIEEKLDYLKDIGVNGVWLSPIFRSPMADFGYDIANFTDIDPIFGTMDDFDDLIKKADTLGLRIILDFVPNHSSDEHEWFKKSIKKIDPFTDYYIWHDGKVNNVSGEIIPPNNWLSVFRGPAWEWNVERGQYYYHQFAVKQPDLNFRNPHLVDEMKDAMTFWLDRGVAGFRVDAVPFLFEVTSLQDEPLSNDPKALPDDYLYLVHNYTVNLEETFDMVQQWRGLMEAYQDPERLMMAEAYADFETTMRYYGTPLSPGAHFPFNFALITDVNGNSTPSDFLKATKKWIDDLPPGALSNWVIGNHDNHRVASRFGRELVDGLNMLALLLPGVAVTYNGEEIGMEDTPVSWEQTKDPQALDAGPERYLQYTRDPERTPFQWDDTTSSGFSNSEVTWLPVNPRYPELNVEAQKKASVSHYHVYKLLTAARATPTVQRGDTQVEVIGDHVFAFTRSVKLKWDGQ
uniref:alpha-glucosidase n=1 Tax=Timema shepardi TaxID=629360 RepID=A0A7R9AZ20_TIMSH|nr:unnamed protein product [Timema shepardi]